jgi:hypothetical protein
MARRNSRGRDDVVTRKFQKAAFEGDGVTLKKFCWCGEEGVHGWTSASTKNFLWQQLLFFSLTASGAKLLGFNTGV